MAGVVVGCGLWLAAGPLHAAITGQWDFNNPSNPLGATVGAPLEFFDGPGGETDLNTRTGTTTSLGVPDVGGEPAGVMIFPKCDPLMGITSSPAFRPTDQAGRLKTTRCSWISSGPRHQAASGDA